MSLKYVIERPVAVLSICTALILVGLVISRIIPASLLPQASIPRVSVQVFYPHVGAQDLESGVVKTIRQHLLQVNNLQDINSETRDGAAEITLDFAFGSNTELSLIEVNEKIDQIMGLLPRDMDRPHVLKASTTDLPVFYLSVVPKVQGSELELADFVSGVLKRRIEQLPQVAFVDISGQSEAELMVTPDRARLNNLGLTVDDLATLLKNNNIEFGTVLIEDGNYQYPVRLVSEMRTAEDLAGIYFKHQDRLLQLRDVARVELRPALQRGKYLFNNKEALVLSVRKQSNAQMFALKRKFDGLLQDFRKDYPELSFHLSNDQSKLLTVSIENLKNSLLFGALFAVAVMFLFYRGWVTPVLVALSIPASLILSMVGFHLLGISVNIISLSGLVLGLGLMVDNAIIVLDNIQQHLKGGNCLTDACVEGVREVMYPLFSSVLTTCSVFGPLVFLSGLAGALFYDQALSVSVTLLTSLSVAFIVLPTLLRALGQGLRSPTPEQPAVPAASLAKVYTRCIDFVLRFRYIFLGLFVLIVAAAFLLGSQLKKETIPSLSQQALVLNIDWNQPISLQENERRTLQLLLHFDEAISSANAFLGERQFILDRNPQTTNQTELLLFLKVDPVVLQQELPKFISKNFPTAVINTTPLENAFQKMFGEREAPLVLHLQDISGAGTVAPKTVNSLLKRLQSTGLFPQSPPLREQYSVEILRDKAILYGVEFDRIYNKLRTLFNVHNAGYLRNSQQHIPIVIGDDRKSLKEKLNHSILSVGGGNFMPLTSFVRIQKSQTYKAITASRTGTTVDLKMPVFQKGQLEKIKRILHDEHTIMPSFSGQTFKNKATIKELVTILLVSVSLLYLILAAQFESLLQPLIVIFVVPGGIAGAIFTLWIFGQSINLISLIGIITLSGIVVNDAILKVDMMNRLHSEYPIRQAIHLAGVRRLKPILMTSLTTILALLPILFASGLGAELQRPLAYSIVGGLAAGTLTSLFLIPALYLLIKNEK